MNIIICGEPRAGKTECAKFISGYIPDYERVITIEDVMEWHHKALNPTADVIEMKVNDDFSYSDGIIASLKQNPKWLMIAETRGKEIKYLLQGFTTGVNGITTLHTDDVRKIPERMINMADDSMTAARMEGNIYEFVDVGILVSMRSDGHGGQKRIIDQIAFFSADNGAKKCRVVVEGGELFRGATIPKKIAKKFKLAGIENPLCCTEVDEVLKEQGFDVSTYASDNLFSFNTESDIEFTQDVLAEYVSSLTNGKLPSSRCELSNAFYEECDDAEYTNSDIESRTTRFQNITGEKSRRVEV